MTSKIFSVDFRFVPENQAVVPVMDRGFLYGESVYEVARTYDGSDVFLLDRHDARLRRSAGRLGIDVPFSYEELRAHVRQALRDLAVPNAYVRVMVSGGRDEAFHLPRKLSQPATFCVFSEWGGYPQRQFDVGLSMKVSSVRRNDRRALDPDIKSGNYLNNVLAASQAVREGFDDTIMVNLSGNLSEASNSNVFLVKNGVVSTPALESGLLQGITRGLLLEILKSRGIRHDVREIPSAELKAADEVFLTSTLREVMPVTYVDNSPVGNGKIGPITRMLADLFATERRRILESTT